MPLYIRKRVTAALRREIGFRMLATPHSVGYAKIVISVDADVDQFDLKQVMWAISLKLTPAGNVMILPNLSVNLLDPAANPPLRTPPSGR